MSGICQEYAYLIIGDLDLQKLIRYMVNNL